MITILTSFLAWLVGDDAHRSSIHPCEPDNNIPGVVWHYLKEVALINNQSNHIQDIVGLVGGVRNDVIETRNQTISVSVCE